METDFQPELWHGLFEMIGTAAAALVGLLFIVVTLHFDKIFQRADHNIRATMDGARNNLYHLLTVLVEAVVVLTPQPLAFMGAELIAINLFGLRLPLTFVHRYVNTHLTISDRGGFPTLLILTIIAAYLLGIAGGGLAIVHPTLGLYLVAISCTIKLVRSVLTAWMLMFGVNHVQATPSVEPPKGRKTKGDPPPG